MRQKPDNYSPATYLEQLQQLVQSLNSLMDSGVIAATMVKVISVIFHRSNKQHFPLGKTAIFYGGFHRRAPVSTKIENQNGDCLNQDLTKTRILEIVNAFMVQN